MHVVDVEDELLKLEMHQNSVLKANTVYMFIFVI